MVSSRNRTRNPGLGLCCFWSRVVTGLASMVSSHAVCVDHGWLRVATYVATVVSACHVLVSSRNGTRNLCRNLWSRLVMLWLRVVTRCSRLATDVATWRFRVAIRGLDSPTVADSAQLYYPIEFQLHAPYLCTIHLNMFLCLIFTQNGSNNADFKYSTPLHCIFKLFFTYSKHIHQVLQHS